MNLLKNQQAAEAIDNVYIDLEILLMENIARHLRDWEQTIDTDKWLMLKLAELGQLNKENIRFIAKMSGLAQEEAERMLNELAEETIQSIEPGFQQLVEEGFIDDAVEVPKSKNVKQVMKNLQEQAKEAINLTNTTMLHKAQEAFKMLAINTAEEAMKIMNSNTAAVITGAESRQQALERTITQFAKRGITGFVDKKGRNWTPEAYINMCMRTTAGQVADQIQTARCEDYGINLIEIDAHAGARPKCAKDQGKIFDMNNGSGTTEDLNGRKIKYYPWNSSSYGEPDGILGINCGHHRFPFVPGLNVQRYFPTDDLDANNKLYKQTQVQRALERDIRKQKRECMLQKEVGNEEAYKQAAVKLKGKEARLKNYVDNHEFLHRRKDRERVVGFDKKLSSETVYTNRKYHRRQEKVEQQSDLGAFKEKLRANEKVEKNYYNKLKSRFSHGNSSAKRVYNKYIDNNFVATGEYFDVPYYDPKTKKIFMNYDTDANNSRGAGVTWFHEHGHLIDDIAGRISNDKDFLELLKQDAFSYRINYGKKNNLKTFDKVDSAISKELHDMRKHSAVSDIMEGVTMGNVRGVSGHGKDYWNDISITSEAFAHMFEAQFDSSRKLEMKKYFPNALKYFEKKLERMV